MSDEGPPIRKYPHRIKNYANIVRNLKMIVKEYYKTGNSASGNVSMMAQACNLEPSTLSMHLGDGQAADCNIGAHTLTYLEVYLKLDAEFLQTNTRNDLTEMSNKGGIRKVANRKIAEHKARIKKERKARKAAEEALPAEASGQLRLPLNVTVPSIPQLAEILTGEEPESAPAPAPAPAPALAEEVAEALNVADIISARREQQVIDSHRRIGELKMLREWAREAKRDFTHEESRPARTNVTIICQHLDEMIAKEERYVRGD